MRALSPRSLPPTLASSLVTAQVLGLFTLLRSVAFDRWMTVAVSLALVAGARAALRGRTWGLLLSFAAALWFPAAFLLGMAPPWFVLIGVLGALPLVKSWRALSAHDGGAAKAAALVSSSAAAFGAVGWKVLAPSLFAAVPAMRPAFFPGHGVALAAIVATAAIVAVRDRRASAAREAGAVRVAEGLEGPHVRVQEHEPVRVADAEEELEVLDEDAPARSGRVVR